MRIPILDLQIERPTRSSLAWYGGIGVMATVGLVEWPLAANIAAGLREHEVAGSCRGGARRAESAAG